MIHAAMELLAIASTRGTRINTIRQGRKISQFRNKFRTTIVASVAVSTVNP